MAYRPPWERQGGGFRTVTVGRPTRPAAPRKETKTPPRQDLTRGIIARDQSGREIRLAGPPAPRTVGGKKYLPPIQYVDRPVTVRRPAAPPQRPRSRPAPRVERAGLPFVGGAPRPVGIKGLANKTYETPGLFAPDARTRAYAIRQQTVRMSRDATRRDDGGGGGVAGFVGRSLVGAGRKGWEIIQGIPGASVEGVKFAGDLAATVLPNQLPPEQRKAAARRAGGYVADTGRYYADLAKDVKENPIGAFENRGLEIMLAAGGAYSVAGRGAAMVARGTGKAGRLATDITTSPTVRSGVAKNRARARARAQEERREAIRRMRPLAVGEGPQPTREYRFRGDAERAAQERRAAEVTGNRGGNRLFEATQRISDWGSQSFLPGSRRYREPERIAPPDTDISGAAPVEVKRRPRSSNPITREIQRVTDRGRGRRRQFAEPIRAAFLIPSAFETAVRRDARNTAYEVRETRERTVAAQAGEFARQTRKLKGAGRRGGLVQSELAQGSAAAVLRLMGAAAERGGSRTWGRDQLIQNAERRIAELDRKRPGIRQAKSRVAWTRERRALEQQVATLKAVPDEWLDPKTAPETINRMVEEGKKISRYSGGRKQEIGLITPETAAFGDIRAQVQLSGGRAVSRIRAEATAQPRRDRKEADAIRAEISARQTRTAPRNKRFDGYTTEALQIREKALRRRSRTIARRVTPFVRRAEEEGLAAYDTYQTAVRELDRRTAELRALQARRDGSAFDETIEEALRDRERGVQEAIMERDRARARATMARQGAVAMDRAQRGRQRRVLDAAQRDRRRAVGDAMFERTRATARARMARQGRIALERARAARLRREQAAARSGAQRAPSVEVELGQVFRAGERKARASARADQRPGQRSVPNARQSRAFGTMLRSDGRLYVARQRQARAESGRDAVRAADEAVRVDRAGRGRRSPAEERALREVVEARARVRELRAQGAPTAPPRGRRQRTPAEEAQLRQLIEARGNLRGTPRQAKGAETRLQRLRGRQSQDRLRPVGSAAQIATAAERRAQARRAAATERQRALRTAYTGVDDLRREGLEPGVFVPQRPAVPERPAAMRVAQTGGSAVASGSRFVPPQEKFNAGVLIERGDVNLSPQTIVEMLSEAEDAALRSEAASNLVSRYAMRDMNGRLITGDAAEELVANSGGMLETISMRQLARISSLSMDKEAGKRLARDIEEAIFANASDMVALPKAVKNGWYDALGPAGPVARPFEYLNSLWKGGVLALSPRWYFQNFFGMWGQFILGAGADLQAITMARSPQFLQAIPGRIAINGLAADLGEYARNMAGYRSNPVGTLIRGGFNLNATLEGVPRKAMFWSAAKRGLRQNEFIKRGVMSPEYLAQAWLDVAEAARKGDPGAEAILDDAILTAERFMGNYSRYNRFEKNFLRILFPFYGWMRAIHRLAFALPVKHPKRAALLAAGSMMAYEDYDLKMNDLIAPRYGYFVGDRVVGLSTLNPAVSVLDVPELAASAGEIVQRTNWRDPLSWADAAWMFATDVARMGAEQSGPLFGIPYRAVTGETPQGIPDRFSPGYDFRFRSPLGGYISVDPVTTGERNTDPRRGFWATLEGSFPLVNAARRAAAGGTPVSDARAADLLGYRLSGARPEDAPNAVVNDPRVPPVTQTDALSIVSNIFLGTPLDRVDWRAAEAREAQFRDRFVDSVRGTQRRRDQGVARARQKKKRQQQRRP